MRKIITCLLVVWWLGVMSGPVRAGTTEVAEITFDSHCLSASTATNGLPEWIVGLEQDGGQFVDQPQGWYVDGSQPMAQGRLSMLVNRQLQQEDLALGIMYEQNDKADFVVQLFDAENRVIVLDLFGNIMDVGKDAKSDTFIIPMRKFPTATKVTIRRISGDLRVYGAVLYPVVGEAEADREALEGLARLMGDPLSPHNPLHKAREREATENRSKVEVSEKHAVVVASLSKPVEHTSQEPAGNGWMVLPFYGDSDWPASKGEPAMVGKNDVLLQGRPVRTIAAYRFPASVECDVSLEERLASDGSLDLFLIPEGQPVDRYPKPMTNLRIIYSNTGEYSSVDRYDLNQSGAGLVWSYPSEKLEKGKVYRVKMSVAADGTLRLSIDGHAFPEVSKIKVPYGRFQVQIGSWQPTNRWHVRNFRVE